MRFIRYYQPSQAVETSFISLLTSSPLPLPLLLLPLAPLSRGQNRHPGSCLGKTFTGIPGPAWNIRSWQISTTVKNLFPSGSDGATQLAGTTWRFVNFEGHILTKKERDDDDESGVVYAEVVGLIRGAVRDGLLLDLPAREGFGEEVVEEVFRRIEYLDDSEAGEECGACHREFQIQFQIQFHPTSLTLIHGT